MSCAFVVYIPTEKYHVYDDDIDQTKICFNELSVRMLFGEMWRSTGRQGFADDQRNIPRKADGRTTW